MFDQWDDLLISGGFAPRAVLLRGLSLEQVSAVPQDAPHSIYQELWHVTTVLRMSLDDGRVALETWPLDEHFPTRPEPNGLTGWEDLVTRYLDSAFEAVERSKEAGWLGSPDPGYEEHGLTWRDSLEFLAVHSAYHFGRIVLLRQLLGAWPPAGEPGR